MELFDFNIHFPVTDPTWIFFLVLIIILFAPIDFGAFAHSAYYWYDTGRGSGIGKYGLTFWT